MSKLSDYSNFDRLDEDDPEDDLGNSKSEQSKTASATTTLQGAAATSSRPSGQPQQKPPLQQANNAPQPRQPTAIQRKHDTEPNRYVFEYDGQPVYEWEQKLEEVTIYVKPPPFIQKGSQIQCLIKANRLQLKIVNATSWYLNEPTFGLVDVDESTWSLEDDEDGGGGKIICIYLIKAQKGLLWDTALKGRIETNHIKLDPACQEEVKKGLLLERFQQENPGFDFQGADFNGSVPDARTFMGGVTYS